MKEPASRQIRVVIADDSRAARESLTGLLKTYPGITVVGTAENGREAVLRIEALQPDLLVMDLNMPVLGGLDAARPLRSRYPALRILMISVHDGPVLAVESREAGADEFLPKPLAPLTFGPLMQRFFGADFLLSPQ